MIRFILSLAVVVFVSQSLALPIEAAVTCPDSSFSEVAGVCVPTGTATGLSDMDVSELLTTFMNWLLGIISVIGILAFVISGFQYLTAAGDEKQAETAKRNIQYAIIGVIVALSGLMVITAIDALYKGDASF